MRPVTISSFAALLTGVILTASPAYAGTVTRVNDQVVWQSTQCVAPATPPSLIASSPESHAEDLNMKISDYNQYVNLMHIYTECMSNEAQNDANNTAHSITASAQVVIDNTMQQADALGAPLKRAQQQQ
jgi:nitrogen fixation/metabolism regulation signal transduction histidine kinase